MASLAFLLGMIPSTEKVESADDQLRADYKAFREFEKSDELKHFLDLEKEVNSSDFAIRKKNIPKKEYRNSEEFKKEEEYAVLKKSEKITWYFKIKKKNPFKEIARWEETFNESFAGTSLDTKRWMTRYFWGDAILDEPYTMYDDKSFPTDGKNVEFYDKKLRLVTRPEEVEGKKWDPVHGFLNDSFEYTSALISTGKSFRQKFGIFKAKIRMSDTDMTQAFWMVGDGLVPHIDVAKLEKGKMHAGYFWRSREKQPPSKSITRTGGSRYKNDFYIFSLEWGPGKLTWRINDKVFKTQTSGVPQDEMYMVFSAGLKQWASDKGLPAAMEIDWIRVYKLKDQD